MRRSICYCEPSVALAGEVRTWKFIYTTSTKLPKGTRLKFDLQSQGRSIDWELPSVDIKKGSNVIYGLLEDKVLSPTEIEPPNAVAPLYEFTLPQELPAEKAFTIVIGAAKGTGKQRYTGTRAQTCAQRRRPFTLHIDPSGRGHYDESELFNMDVRGDKLSTIRIIAPSFVSKNKRFDAVVRFEDAHGNLTSNTEEDVLIELSHENLRENLSWKLFVPETGFINLPNLYFNEPGVYTIALKNTKTGETFCAPPIKCFNEADQSVFWGLLHGESERYDSTESIESCLRHFRDERAFSFYGISPFESQEETPTEVWKSISQHVGDFDEDQRFTTFLGTQWSGVPNQEGSRLILFAKESKTLPRKKEQKYSSLAKLYGNFHPKEILSIPCFTMGEKVGFNFKTVQPEFERLVEIYNAWGSSECTVKDGNKRPIRCYGKKGMNGQAEGSIQKALQKNCRFGFTAGGLDDRGLYANFYDGDQEQYSPGLTAIISRDHSRQALFESLYQRSCYATTGARIIVGLFVAGFPMGSELSTTEKPGLTVNRHLTGYVAGTTKLVTVEIIRNGSILHTITPDDYHCEFTYDDMTPLGDICINAQDKKPPFVYYYLRVTQEDEHLAWSSPIWVENDPAVGSKNKRSQKNAAAKEAKSAFLELDALNDDDDDFDDEEEEDEDDLE